MSWLLALDSELRMRGMRGRDRERIVLELADHIGCDPGSEERLGDPATLAAAFVDELVTAKSRRAAFDVFTALAATAVVLAVSQAGLGQIGYPGFNGWQRLPAAWPGLAGGLGAVAVAALVHSWRGLGAVRRLRSSAAGPGGSVHDDLPCCPGDGSA
jgi:hypothetical protein